MWFFTFLADSLERVADNASAKYAAPAAPNGTSASRRAVRT